MAKNKKRCFVVMGFGIKTDFATGRKLDLNKSYRLLIKPVVEEKGLICLRADEIQHAGIIDVPMYAELMSADVVVADLSTANLNAFYELGVRHALRPRTTIVISEDKMSYPFDINHISITSYTHLGDAIDFDEVERFRKVLGDKLDAVLELDEPDSPVYTFLDLVPPSLQQKITTATTANIKKLKSAASKKNGNKTLSTIAEEAEYALTKNDFSTAKNLFGEAVQLGRSIDQSNQGTGDAYLIHRLALATYKASEPDAVTALKLGLQLLSPLGLDNTNDPETVALAGAMEKRLYEHKQGDTHLSAAILYYQRGYYLLNNRYNGINLAFMLDYRAQSTLNAEKEERLADKIAARRIRKEVLVMCDKEWKTYEDRSEKQKSIATTMKDFTISQMASDKEQMFWILINKAEAYFGLDDSAGYKKALDAAKQMEHETWMMDSLKEQINKLKKIKKKLATLTC